MSRKIFNCDNISENKIIASLECKEDLYENSISACGCLFYRIYKSKLQLLLISYSDPKWPKLDDLGGRIDETDNSVFDAIARETSEETNGVINVNFMMSVLFKSDSNKFFYNKQSKYYVVVSQVNEHFYPDTTVFGDFETTDKINRVIKWFDYDQVKPNLAFRLLYNSELIGYLDSIKN